MNDSFCVDEATNHEDEEEDVNFGEITMHSMTQIMREEQQHGRLRTRRQVFNSSLSLFSDC